MTEQNDIEIATLAGGCFWCIEAVYNELKGVKEVISGYTGGKTVNPSYEDVCSGRTGHAEAINIKFNPDIISYKELLEIFFTIHDPTTLNRQGNDIGTQYRSVIFYHTPEQKVVAEEVVAELKKTNIWETPIVTELKSFTAFYPAEDYHQQFYEQNPNHGYCRVVIAPKVSKFRKKYFEKLKK